MATNITALKPCRKAEDITLKGISIDAEVTNGNYYSAVNRIRFTDADGNYVLIAGDKIEMFVSDPEGPK